VRVLGIDPGSRVTGFGVVTAERGETTVVASGTVEPPPGGTFASRLRAVHDGIRAVILEHRPDEAAIEDAFLAKNVKTVALISQVRGVLLLAIESAGLPVTEYPPREVKMAVTGNGNASKEQVERMVARLLALPGAAPARLDESDALAVALCHAHRARARALARSAR
jgi:crossover junction endodeoxyribonuclease RuvC